MSISTYRLLVVAVVATLCAVAFSDLAARGGGGGGGGGTRTSVGGSGGGGNRSASGGGNANRSASANTNANRGANVNSNGNANVNRNVNANSNTNVNRNVNANSNVNVNRNVNVDVDNDWNNGWDHHPVAAAATVGAAVAVTSAAIGSIAYSVPPSCAPVNVNGATYQQCGSTWYQPQYAGSSVQYVVVAPPN